MVRCWVCARDTARVGPQTPKGRAEGLCFASSGGEHMYIHVRNGGGETHVSMYNEFAWGEQAISRQEKAQVVARKFVTELNEMFVLEESTWLVRTNLYKVLNGVGRPPFETRVQDKCTWL